jgi:hypothetical protein
LVLCALWACGGDDGGGAALDPDTWSGMHVNQIQKDCNETVQCMNQRGEPLVEDPINNCVKATAKLLESDMVKRDQFISNNQRCAQFVVCQYYDCAITDATSSYGQSQLASVMHDCGAEVECLQLLGTPPADPQFALDSCISNNTALLNSYTADQRVGYEQAYAACAGLTGCDFNNCFTY